MNQQERSPKNPQEIFSINPEYQKIIDKNVRTLERITDNRVNETSVYVYPIREPSSTDPTVGTRKIIIYYNTETGLISMTPHLAEGNTNYSLFRTKLREKVEAKKSADTTPGNQSKSYFHIQLDDDAGHDRRPERISFIKGSMVTRIIYDLTDVDRIFLNSIHAFNHKSEEKIRTQGFSSDVPDPSSRVANHKQNPGMTVAEALFATVSNNAIRPVEFKVASERKNKDREEGAVPRIIQIIRQIFRKNK